MTESFNESKAINIGSKPFFIYLIYIIYIMMCEVFDLVYFLIDQEYSTTFFYTSRVLLFIVWSIILIRLLKNKRLIFEVNKKLTLFYAGAAFIAIYGFFRSVIPDGATDTGNYHLLVQNPGFTNYFIKGFAGGNFQVWGFRLSDRLFFIFRKLFGFRMGTSLNIIILIISYYELCQIMYSLKGEDHEDNYLIDTVIQIIALLAIIQHKNTIDIGLYYVDVTAFPIGLEVLRLIMKATREKPSQIQIIYFAFLNGIWFAMKMTNVVYVAPAIIIYIVVCGFKYIKVGTYIKSLVAGICPWTSYLIYNYYCTGNPVFPYFNKLFKSPYFMASDWKDTRWGGETTIQKIFWPVCGAFDPTFRQSEVFTPGTLLYKFGIISVILILIIILFNKNKKALVNRYHPELMIFFIACSILWGFSTGYERYFQFGYTITSIFAFEVILSIADRVRHKNIISGLIYILIGTLCYSTYVQIASVSAGREWSWRNSLPESEPYKENKQYVFHDYEYQGIIPAEDIGTFIVSSENPYSGQASWINPDAEIINVDYINYVPDENKANVLKQIHYLLNDNDKIYGICNMGIDLTAYDEKIKAYGLEIVNTVENKTNIGDYYFVEMRYIGELKVC